MTKGIATKLLPASTVAVLLLAGCGSDGGRSEPSGNAPEQADIRAESPADREIAEDLRAYMVRNCPAPNLEIPDRVANRYGPQALEKIEGQFQALKDFCGSVRSVAVENKRITMDSDLGSGDKAAGEAFCMIVRGSDVADPTPFHTLLDRSGRPIKVCGTRNAYR